MSKLHKGSEPINRDSISKIENFREWLTKYEIFFKTLAAILLSGMAVFISYAQYQVMQIQSDIAAKQYQTSIDPEILIEPRTAELAKNGLSSITIINDGDIDIIDLELWVTYLYCDINEEGPGRDWALNNPKIEGFPSLPEKKYAILKSKDKIIYAIDLAKLIKKLNNKQNMPCYLKFGLCYKRKVDGHLYYKRYAFSLGNVTSNLEFSGFAPLMPEKDKWIKEFLFSKY
jgi:hypothetical protein